MYEKRLGDAGYLNFKLARTNNRGDGRYLSSSSLILYFSLESLLFIHLNLDFDFVFLIDSDISYLTIFFED
jgi:hypothetical protein